MAATEAPGWYDARTLRPDQFQAERKAIIERGFIVLVTGNEGKRGETAAILTELEARYGVDDGTEINVEIAPLRGLVEIQGNGDVYEIAESKAKEAYKRRSEIRSHLAGRIGFDGKWLGVFTEDTALAINSIIFPGPFVAALFNKKNMPIGTTDKDFARIGCDRIIKMADGTDRRATATTIYGTIAMDGRTPLLFVGERRGFIVPGFREGPNGFAWDHAVRYEGVSTPVSFMDPVEKNLTSMRFDALRGLYRFLHPDLAERIDQDILAEQKQFQEAEFRLQQGLSL